MKDQRMTVRNLQGFMMVKFYLNKHNAFYNKRGLNHRIVWIVWLLKDQLVSARCGQRHLPLDSVEKANHILGYVKRGMTSRSREGILLLFSYEIPPGVLCSAWWAPTQERSGPVGAHPEEAAKKINGLEDLSCEDRLRELGMFSLKLWGDFTALSSSYERGGLQEIWRRTFGKGL
ncbi:hypothetical protein BTVI_69507 [Pitangus sulphuratus]|nr:hypothetical protein BTVI_69507 [Pitangus sulphuratus]